MPSMVIVSSPLGNSHSLMIKRHDENGRVTEEQLAQPGETAIMTIHGDCLITVIETMKKSLVEQT
jgi:hypothetical protein